MNVENRDPNSPRVDLTRVRRYGDLLITFFQSDGSPMARTRIKKGSFLEFVNENYRQELKTNKRVSCGKGLKTKHKDKRTEGDDGHRK
jgi:hypothetical protein